MEAIEDQIRALQVSLKRQRTTIIGLSIFIVASRFASLLPSTGDASFDKVTCKEWWVVDKAGKERIKAMTFADGGAGMGWLDQYGQTRITVEVSPDGDADLHWLDRHGTERIKAGTSADGIAGMGWKDKNGKVRMAATTDDEGLASMCWFDNFANLRIATATKADGTPVYPSKDGN
jgi:hypothetical protein